MFEKCGIEFTILIACGDPNGYAKGRFMSLLHSIYFKGHSLEAHRKLFEGMVNEMAPIFKEGASIEAILHSVFTAMFDFAIRVYNAMISDSLAMQTANYESGAGHGQQGIINIGVLDRNFNAHDVITLSILKEKGLISPKVGRMKVLADGILNKPLTVKSESYSIQAIKMIELTGGTVIILED